MPRRHHASRIGVFGGRARFREPRSQSPAITTAPTFGGYCISKPILSQPTGLTSPGTPSHPFVFGAPHTRCTCERCLADAARHYPLHSRRVPVRRGPTTTYNGATASGAGIAPAARTIPARGQSLHGLCERRRLIEARESESRS
jgi:hypothetical protein